MSKKKINNEINEQNDDIKINWADSLIIKDEETDKILEKDNKESSARTENRDTFFPVSKPISSTLSYIKIKDEKDIDVISAIVSAPAQKSKPINKNAIRGVYNLNGKIGKN